MDNIKDSILHFDGDFDFSFKLTQQIEDLQERRLRLVDKKDVYEQRTYLTI